jgi:hypothetical protein
MYDPIAFGKTLADVESLKESDKKQWDKLDELSEFKGKIIGAILGASMAGGAGASVMAEIIKKALG